MIHFFAFFVIAFRNSEGFRRAPEDLIQNVGIITRGILHAPPAHANQLLEKPRRSEVASVEARQTGLADLAGEEETAYFTSTVRRWAPSSLGRVISRMPSFSVALILVASMPPGIDREREKLPWAISQR